MSERDFSALQTAIEENGYTYVENINPEIAELMVKFENIGSIGIEEHETDKWKDFLRLCGLHDELRIRALKTPMPEKFLRELYTSLNRYDKEVIFSNPSLTQETLGFVIDDLKAGKIKELFDYEKDIFHQNTLQLMAKMDINKQAELDFMHYELVFPDVDLRRKIWQTLNDIDKEWFGDEIPEKFTTSIINNPKMDDEVRFLAFKKSFSPYEITNTTKDIAKGIYTLCADVIFDSNEEFKNTDAQKDADVYILNMVKRNQLPESCQIDFIERYLNNPQPNTQRALFSIIESTNQNYVLQQALRLPNPRKYLISTNDNIDCDTLRVLMSMDIKHNLKRGFTKMALNRNIDYDIAEEFIDMQDHEVNTSLVVSYNSGERLAKLVVDKTKDLELKNMLQAIFDMRETAFENFSQPHGKHMMYMLAHSLLSNSIYKKCSTEINDALNVNDKNTWNRITGKEYVLLNHQIQEMKVKYPQFNKTWDFILNRAERIHTSEKLYNKYPEVFNSENSSYDIPSDKIYYNIENLMHLSMDEMDEMGKDIINVRDRFMLYRFKLQMLSYLDDLHSYKSDEIYLATYKLCNLYNAIEKREQELIQEFSKEREEEKDVR